MEQFSLNINLVKDLLTTARTVCKVEGLKKKEAMLLMYKMFIIQISFPKKMLLCDTERDHFLSVRELYFVAFAAFVAGSEHGRH